MSQTVILMFNNVSAYEEHKRDILANGGSIKNDYGAAIMGFAANVPPTLLATLQSSSFADNGISSIEADSVVTTQ